MSNIIKVRSLKDPKSSWSGFVRYKNTKHYITPYYDATGTIVTGLDREDEERLGKLLKRDLSPTSPYWYEYNIIMTDKEKLFNIDNPEQELAYKFLLAHKICANSETDRNNWPYAEYVIYNEDLEAKVKNEKNSVLRKAVTEYNKLSVDQMRDVLKLYPGFVRLESVTADIIESKLFDFVQSDPAKFLNFVGDKNLDMKVFLKDLVNAKVLRKNKMAFYYGTDILGHDEESTIAYLEDPNNNGFLITLKKELEGK